MDLVHICPSCGALYRCEDTRPASCQSCDTPTVYSGYDYDTWCALPRAERADIKRSVMERRAPRPRQAPATVQVPPPSTAPGRAVHHSDPSTYSHASGKNLHYVVLQVTLKEKLFGTGSGNLTELENVINKQCAKGYRLHTIATTNGGSKGLGGGDRIQATLVFESLG